MTSAEYLKTDKSRLGFGAMRLPDAEQTAKMVDAYLEGGYCYFDTAHVYEGSEAMLKKTLTTRHPRDSYFVATKLPPWLVKDQADCDKIFATSLKRTGLDYFDFYLIHSLDDSREARVEEIGAFDWAYSQKKKGLVRHVGFSFHGTGAYLERLLKRYPDVEFVQLQLNYMDILRGPALEWQQLAIKYNVPIIVMEPIKGGSLAKLPQAAEDLLRKYDKNRSTASWALQYAATLGGVSCVLSGMSTLEQVHDNLTTYKNLKPLSLDETELLYQVLNEMSKVAGVQCTACKYCISECPQGIDIASCFGLYNEQQRGGAKWNISMLYKTLGPKKQAHNCTQCGACLSHCPQHIDIPGSLGTVAAAFK